MHRRAHHRCGELRAAVLAAAAALAVAACGSGPGSGPDSMPGSDAAIGADAAPGGRDAAPVKVDASGDGTPVRNTCTSNFGNALTSVHGRLDGFLVSIVPDGTSNCNGDRDHLHLQIEMNGRVYDVAINIYDKYNSANNAIDFTEADMPLPQGPWLQGWHPNVDLDYTTLGLHSTQFTAMTEAQLRAKITGELANVNHITVFMTAYGPDGGHDIHRRNGGNDGALFLQPLSANAHGLFFHFYDQSF